MWSVPVIIDAGVQNRLSCIHLWCIPEQQVQVQVMFLLCAWSAYHYYSDKKIQLKWKKSQQFSLTTNWPSPCFPMILSSYFPISAPHPGPLFGATPGSNLCYRAFFLHSLLSDEFISLTYWQHLLKGSIENFIALPKFPSRSIRTLLNHSLSAVDLVFL